MKKIIRIIVCVIALLVFCFSGWKIYEIVSTSSTAKKHYESYEKYIKKNVEETEKETVQKQPKENQKPLTVDFKGLKQDYPDAIGWIYFQDGSISYPVMQGEDNSYYLNHLPDGTENFNGSIFADYRNISPVINDNFIIYGHNMKNDSMFGKLDKYHSQSYYNKNRFFYYFTAEKTYKVKIFAGCNVNAKSELFNVDFEEAELADLMKTMKVQSTFSGYYDYEKGDKLITLSTCAGNSDETRYVLIGIIQ